MSWCTWFINRIIETPCKILKRFFTIQVCCNFNAEQYNKVQEAYCMLGKTQTSMDQLQMHVTSAVHNTAWNVVYGHAMLSNPAELVIRHFWFHICYVIDYILRYVMNFNFLINVSNEFFCWNMTSSEVYHLMYGFILLWFVSFLFRIFPNELTLTSVRWWPTKASFRVWLTSVKHFGCLCEVINR